MGFATIHRHAHKVAMVLLIAGAINWLSIAAFEYNIIAKQFGAKSMVTRAIYLLVGIAAIALMFHRDTYLPFLGETVLPCSALPEQIPEGADSQIQVKVAPNSKVLYWAAEPQTEGMKKLNDWRQAYTKFMNVGVVKSDVTGVATLYMRNPQPYTVPWIGRLEPHVHFRVCGDNGMMGSIHTVYMSSGSVEKFVNISA
jgi:uncharacterized membrane protein YuzA (DUF378 family)